jgi:antitoxin component of RelBE/YafQ-DinJ toxin-antitoxin module
MLQTRVEPKIRDEIKKTAKALGLTASEYQRMAILIQLRKDRLAKI